MNDDLIALQRKIVASFATERPLTFDEVSKEIERIRAANICPTCRGSGCYFNTLLGETRPCIDCDGRGQLPRLPT
jgi:DnaJ-class molecular chaperone